MDNLMFWGPNFCDTCWKSSFKRIRREGMRDGGERVSSPPTTEGGAEPRCPIFTIHAVPPASVCVLCVWLHVSLCIAERLVCTVQHLHWGMYICVCQNPLWCLFAICMTEHTAALYDKLGQQQLCGDGAADIWHLLAKPLKTLLYQRLSGVKNPLCSVDADPCFVVSCPLSSTKHQMWALCAPVSLACHIVPAATSVDKRFQSWSPVSSSPEGFHFTFLLCVVFSTETCSPNGQPQHEVNTLQGHRQEGLLEIHHRDYI